MVITYLKLSSADSPTLHFFKDKCVHLETQDE